MLKVSESRVIYSLQISEEHDIYVSGIGLKQLKTRKTISYDSFKNGYKPYFTFIFPLILKFVSNFHSIIVFSSNHFLYLSSFRIWMIQNDKNFRFEGIFIIEIFSVSMLFENSECFLSHSFIFELLCFHSLIRLKYQVTSLPNYLKVNLGPIVVHKTIKK